MILYRCLLRLYPSEHREEFSGEMTAVFRDARATLRNENATARLSFYAREFSGLLRGATGEHVRKIFGSERWTPIKETPMRPQFRFPRLTIFLMALSFALVMGVIHKAKIIQLKYAPDSPIAPVWFTLPSAVGFLLFISLLTVAIVLGVLVMLHRSGVHRLENLRPWADSDSQGKMKL